jgi:hypothetical protein
LGFDGRRNAQPVAEKRAKNGADTFLLLGRRIDRGLRGCRGAGEGEDQGGGGQAVGCGHVFLVTVKVPRSTAALAVGCSRMSEARREHRGAARRWIFMNTAATRAGWRCAIL